MTTIDSRIKLVDTDMDVMVNLNRVYALVDTVASSVAELQDSQLFKVTFDSDGGSSVANQYVVEGDKVVQPDNPTKDGYTFVKWMKGTSEYNFNSAVEDHLNLKATWEADANPGTE